MWRELVQTLEELPTERTPSKKVFRIAPNRFLAVVAEDLHYVADDGSLQETDLTFQDGAINRGPIGVELEAGKTLRLRFRKQNISIPLPIPIGVTLAPDTDRIWIEQGSGVPRLALRVTPRKIKFESEPVTSSVGSYTVTLPFPGMGFRERADGGLDGPLGIQVTRPVIIGRNGRQYPCGPLRVALGRVVFDVNDRNLPAEAFPYIVDPTVTVYASAYDTGGVIGTTHSQPYPAHLSYGDVHHHLLFGCGNYSYQVGNDYYYSVDCRNAHIRFSPGLPSNVTNVNSATMYLYWPNYYQRYVHCPLVVRNSGAPVDSWIRHGGNQYFQGPPLTPGGPAWTQANLNITAINNAIGIVSWTVGNTITFVLAPDGTWTESTLFWDSDHGSQYTPYLTIDYTAPQTYPKSFSGTGSGSGTVDTIRTKVSSIEGEGSGSGQITEIAREPGQIRHAGDRSTILLAEYGFEVEAGSIVRSDITAAIPRISVATESKRRSDFSELDTLGQFTFMHGRGQLQFSDPAAYLDGQFIDTRIPGQAIPAPKRWTDSLTETVIDLLYWPKTGKVYALTATRLYERPVGTSDGWTEVTGATSLLQAANSTPTRMWTFSLVSSGRNTTDYLIISRGALPYIYTSNGSTFTAVSDGSAMYFATFKERLAFDRNNTTVVLRPNPTTTTNEIAITNLGSADEAITNLIPFGELLIVFKESEVYAIFQNADGTTYSSKPVINYRWARGKNNGKAAVAFMGSLYFNVGNSIYQYTGNTLRSVGPDLGTTEGAAITADINGVLQASPSRLVGDGPPPEKQGPIVDMTQNASWIFAALDAEIDQVLAYGGQGWHELSQVSQIKRVWFLPKLGAAVPWNTPTLWVACAGTLYYYRLPDGVENRWNYRAADYEDQNQPMLITSWFTADLPEVWKDWLELYLDMETPGPSATITVDFQVDYDDTWYTLGTSFGHEPLRFPDNSQQASGLRAKAIRLRFRWQNQVDKGARLKGFFFRFISRPEVRYGWKLTINAQTLLSLVDRTVSPVSADEVSRILYQLRRRPGPLRFDDGRPPSQKTNFLRNPGFEGWLVTSPVNWEPVGQAVIRKDAQIKWQGGYSCRIEANAGEGVRSSPIDMLPPGTYHAVVRTRVQQGSVTITVRDEQDQILGQAVAMTTNRKDIYAEVGIDKFERVSFPFTITTPTSVRLQVTADSPGSRFWIDATEIRDGIDDESDYVAEGEPRCRPSVPGTFFNSTATRYPFWMVYISGISEVYFDPRQELDEQGNPHIVYQSRIQLELREAF